MPLCPLGHHIISWPPYHIFSSVSLSLSKTLFRSSPITSLSRSARNFWRKTKKKEIAGKLELRSVLASKRRSTMRSTPCELCKEAASFYCPSDSAFLCSGCDARVHQANFLVARHVRLRLCSGCCSLSDQHFSGAGPRRSALCLSCSDHLSVDAGSLSSSSSSSACISSTESLAIAPKGDKCSSAGRKLEKTGLSSSLTGEGSDSPARFDGAAAFSGEVGSGKRNGGTDDRRARTARFRETTSVDPKAEGVFAIWCRKLGLSGGEAVAIASRALRVRGATPTALSPRVAMAASFWVAMRWGKGRGMSTWQNLKRGEGISGVPAKLILAGEVKLVRGARVEKARREERLEEGSAECTA